MLVESAGANSISRVPELQSYPGFDGHENVFHCRDEQSGLSAYVALHDCTLGNALGGCRMWPYANEAEAIQDVLRLSQGMTLKHAIAGTRMGGGKAVIIGDSKRDKSPELLAAFARFVDSLDGKYTTAEDVGIGVPDVVAMGKETRHVAGLPNELGGSGDPSPFTAFGVYCGIQASLAHQANESYCEQRDLSGTSVIVQGLGNVGFALCKHLHGAGAELVVCDPRQDRVHEAVEMFSARAIGLDEVYSTEADVYAPCALGSTLNSQTASTLLCRIVAGGANNQLEHPGIEQQLFDRDILYAPDFAINAGGIINISYEKQGYDYDKAWQQTGQIGMKLTEIFQSAVAANQLPGSAAVQMAKELLRSNGAEN